MHECLNGPTSVSNILYTPESMNKINFNIIHPVVQVHSVDHFQRPVKVVKSFFRGVLKKKGAWLFWGGTKVDSRVNLLLTCLLITISAPMASIDLRKYTHLRR